jgi:hypothetical protein
MTLRLRKPLVPSLSQRRAQNIPMQPDVLESPVEESL